jgi:hypothetical protein
MGNFYNKYEEVGRIRSTIEMAYCTVIGSSPLLSTSDVGKPIPRRKRLRNARASKRKCWALEEREKRQWQETTRSETIIRPFAVNGANTPRSET